VLYKSLKKISSIRHHYIEVLTFLTLIGALVVTHAMLRRLTSWRCIIIIIIIITTINLTELDHSGLEMQGCRRHDRK